MKKIYVFLIKTVAISILLLLGYHFLTKNNPHGDDFFEEVFNVKNIDVDVICYNNPRMDPDHCVLMQFYRLKNIEKEKLELGIITKNNSLKGIEIDSFYDYIKCKYRKKEYFKWFKTPASEDIFDAVKVSFDFGTGFGDLKGDEKDCFTQKELINVLTKEGNYYTVLEQNSAVLAWDVNTEKLYYLTGGKICPDF